MKIFKGFLVGLLACFLLGAGFGKGIYDYLVVNNYIDITASAAPATAPTGTARIYVDSTSGTPFISANAQSYVPLIAQPKYNYIVNPDGAIFQRGQQAASTPLLNISTDAYGQDRWKVCHSFGASGCNCTVSNQQFSRLNSKSITSNTATVSDDGYISFIAGEHFTVACNPADAVFDGPQVVVGNGFGLNFNFSLVHANIASTPTGGYVKEQGLSSSSYMIFNNAGVSGKMLVIQVIDGTQAQYLRGRTVAVQFKQKGTPANGNLRCALVQWATNATAISVETALWANPLVATWNATGTDPTFTATGTNNYALVAPTAVLSGLGGSFVSSPTSAYQVALNADWTQGGFTVVVPTDFQQLALAFWTNSTISTASPICLSEVGVYDALEVQPYNVRNIQQELAMCQRYCYTVSNQSVGNSRIGTGATSSTSAIAVYIPFPQRLRATPVCSFSGTAGNMTGAEFNGAGTAVCTAAPTFVNPDANGCYTQFNNASATWGAANLPCQVYWSTATFNDQLIFNADY